MIGPPTTIVRDIEAMTRAVRWFNEGVLNWFVKRGRVTALIKGFVVIIDIYSLGP
jgi:hypothetical protein